MTALYLLEPDVPGIEWAPFAGTAPLCELRAGAWRLRERWERALGTATAGVIAAHATARHTASSPKVVRAQDVTGAAWVVDALFAPNLPLRPIGDAKRLLHDRRAVPSRLDAGQAWTGPFDGGNGIVIEGRALRSAADLVTALELFLFTDTLAGLEGGTDPIPDGTIVLGNPGAVALRGAALEPGVVLDVRKGAIVLERGVQVRSGTRLEGPFWAHAETLLLGGAMRHVSAGPHCRLHGEISTSVFTGWTNKSHDGFVGHSVVGAWVNLGAGTITSNLKNTYGTVRLDIGTERIETDRHNLGALIGDHVKTAIGTLLPTGSVVGAGANLFDEVRAPKYVPPFAWGGRGPARLDADAFVAVAKRVLPRRDVPVDAAMEEALRAMHRRLATT